MPPFGTYNPDNAFNLEMSQDKKTLTLVIDLTKKPKVSSTGKTRILSSTGGFMPVKHKKYKGAKLSLNLTIPND
jgi:hypothetical protein